MKISELIEKRKATKVYKKTNTLTSEELELILKAGNLAPSANNLQDVKIVVLRSKEAKDKYLSGFEEFNYLNVKIAEAVFLFIGLPWKKEVLNDGQRIYDVALKFDKNDEAAKQTSKERILNYYATISKYSDNLDIYTTGIKFGFMVLQATALGYDSLPMLGLKTTHFEEMLLEEGLMEKGDRLNFAFSVGHADEEAKRNQGYKRNRLPLKEVTKVI